MLHVLEIYEFIKDGNTYKFPMTQSDFERDYLPRLKSMAGILRVGSFRVDLTHTLSWKYYERKTGRVLYQSK